MYDFFLIDVESSIFLKLYDVIQYLNPTKITNRSTLAAVSCYSYAKNTHSRFIKGNITTKYLRMERDYHRVFFIHSFFPNFISVSYFLSILSSISFHLIKCNHIKNFFLNDSLNAKSQRI